MFKLAANQKHTFKADIAEYYFDKNEGDYSFIIDLKNNGTRQTDLNMHDDYRFYSVSEFSFNKYGSEDFIKFSDRQGRQRVSYFETILDNTYYQRLIKLFNMGYRNFLLPKVFYYLGHKLNYQEHNNGNPLLIEHIELLAMPMLFREGGDDGKNKDDNN